MSEFIRCFVVERRDGQFVRIDSNVVLCDTVFLLPPGAMWLRNHGALLPRDDPSPLPMPHLAVMTPAGMWCVDCPASDEPHGHWKRHGTPPDVTASPSIIVGRGEWHGWLKQGRLEPCP